MKVEIKIKKYEAVNGILIRMFSRVKYIFLSLIFGATDESESKLD